MQHAFYSSMIVSKAPQNIKSVEDSSRKNGKDPRRISSIVLVLFRLYSFPLQRTSLHFSELSSAPASHLVLCDSQGILACGYSFCAMRPVIESSSTPYKRLLVMLSGSIPKKLPTPMDGSKIFPDWKPIFSTAS